MDWMNAPDESAAETARLGRQDTMLGDAQNAQRTQALIGALRNYGQQAGGPSQGRMVGKFYVPANQNQQIMSSVGSLANTFMKPGGGLGG